MKICPDCGDRSSDSASRCGFCGKSFPPSGRDNPENRDHRGSGQHTGYTASPPVLRKFRGQFRLQEPDAKAACGYRILTSTGTIAVGPDEVLLREKRTFMKAMLFLLFSLFFLLFFLAFMAMLFTGSAGPAYLTVTGLGLLGVILVYLLVAVLVLKMWTTLPWRFPLSSIANVAKGNSRSLVTGIEEILYRIANVDLGRRQGDALEFVVLPPGQGKPRKGDCSFVTFVPTWPRDLPVLLQLLPKTIARPIRE